MIILAGVVNDAFTSWQPACPTCRAPLAVEVDLASCTGCATAYPRTDGIWRCLAPDRRDAFTRFEHEYHTIRRAEGWGGESADYYRALPWTDLSGRFSALWQIRARSFSTLVDRVLPRLHARGVGRALDLGCGNGWLAYRLTQRGLQVTAID